jgi:hypothetical protein
MSRTKTLTCPTVAALAVSMGALALIGNTALAASTSGYNKTMIFKAKQCQAVVRDLPDSARIDTQRGASGTDKGQLIYGKASRDPTTLSFTCVYGQLTEKSLGRVLSDDLTTSSCSPGGPGVVLGPGRQRMPPCRPYPFTNVSGTNVNFFTFTLCGGSSGSSGPACGSSLEYALALHGVWILFDASQRSSLSPSQWVVTMLQHSTFRVQRGAGGNPKNPFLNEPADWILPNNWLLDV